MFHATYLAVLLGGFFAGLIGVQLITRGLRLLYAFLGKSTGEPKRFVPNKHLWAIPFLVFYPGTWVLVGIVYLGYAAYSGRVASTWGWFVAGFFLSIVLLCTLVFVAFYRLKRKRVRAAGA